LRTLCVLLPLVVVGVVASCGTERPNGASEGSSSPNPIPGVCGTPNEGCECYEPGKIVECGVVSHKSDSYVACSMGKRECIGNKWGGCVGDQDITVKRFVAAGGVSTLALGIGTRCGGDGGPPANLCDPYCNGFVDDATALDGGTSFTTVDGGLVIAPTADGGDASAPGAFTSTAGGVVSCGGATNLNGPACTPPGYGTCQQDHHCDVLTNTCLWNGAAGYFDPTVLGIDLTVGAPCGPSGSGAATAPVCNRGNATLAAGSTITFHVTAGVPASCTNLGAPTSSFLLAAALAPGACTSFNIGNSTGNKVITVNAGAPGAVVEAAGLCANNSAVFKDDGAPGCATCTACNTTLTGRVYDPSGTPSSVPVIANSNSIPLAGVTVFQPVGPLKVHTDGVQCDTCESLSTPAQAQANTDANGNFTLTNVSPGTAVPIVVQSGRWRRAITMNVPACVTTPVTNGILRLPRHRTDGLGGVAGIPKTALITGNKDSLECFLAKVGITSAFGTGEIQARTGVGNANRIQLWRDNGMTTPTPTPLPLTTLMNSQAFINEYASIVMDCIDDTGSDGYAATAAQSQRFGNFANAGGRIFMDHWPGVPFIQNNTLTPGWTGGGVATFVSYTSPGTMKGRINTATPQQILFRDWLSNVGASTDYGFGTIQVDTPRRILTDVNATNSTEWIRGSTVSPTTWNTATAGNMALSLSFETPIGPGNNCGVPNGRGRVLYNGMHIASTRTSSASGIFPNNCNLVQALTPEEKALEYQFFQLTACQLGGAPPPPPPPIPPPLAAVTFTRDYQGVCAVGEQVKWGPFYWQADIPTGTSIVFRAATASSIAMLPASPPAGAPTTAAVHTASATTAAPAFNCQGCPSTPVAVDAQLIADTATKSKDFLRVYMNFQPMGSTSPTLYNWRQIYDCVPAE
jgi:hypothetical protein